MKHHHSVCMALVLSMALTAFAQMPASGPASTVLLAPTGLSAGPVQETLIQGAIAHLQINSIGNYSGPPLPGDRWTIVRDESGGR